MSPDAGSRCPGRGEPSARWPRPGPVPGLPPPPQALLCAGGAGGSVAEPVGRLPQAPRWGRADRTAAAAATPAGRRSVGRRAPFWGSSPIARGACVQTELLASTSLRPSCGPCRAGGGGAQGGGAMRRTSAGEPAGRSSPPARPPPRGGQGAALAAPNARAAAGQPRRDTGSAGAGVAETGRPDPAPGRAPPSSPRRGARRRLGSAPRSGLWAPVAPGKALPHGAGSRGCSPSTPRPGSRGQPGLLPGRRAPCTAGTRACVPSPGCAGRGRGPAPRCPPPSVWPVAAPHPLSPPPSQGLRLPPRCLECGPHG